MDIEIIAQKFYDYSSFIRGYSSYTIRRYRQVINQYRAFSGADDLSQFTEQSARDFLLNGRVERKWSVNTFINYHKSLTVFLRWCIKQGYYECENFMKNIELPRLEKKLPPKLTKQEALRLLEVVFNAPYDYRFLRFRNHAIFATFIYAGLRKSELINLQCMDIDVENFTIFVRQGKGGKDRIVPMSFTLAQSLKQYMVERKRLGKTCPEFFASLNRDKGFTNSGLKNLVVRIRKCSDPIS